MDRYSWKKWTDRDEPDTLEHKYRKEKAKKEEKDIYIQIKLLIKNKLIICALGNLHYEISREKF